MVIDYLELRRLLGDDRTEARAEFRRKFASFYDLNNARPTDAFKERYFERLFAYEAYDRVDPYTPLLRELYQLPRRKGDQAIHASFVSKLIAINDERRPIFDKYVSGFFGLCVPTFGSIDTRMAGFVRNLGVIRACYEEWTNGEPFADVVASIESRVPEIAMCHRTRICDFLVWTIGRKRLTYA